MTFINDGDGLSAKDVLMILAIVLFTLSFVAGLVKIMIGSTLGHEFFDLMQVAQPIFITIIGGVMGVQCTEAITRSISKRAEVVDSSTPYTAPDYQPYDSYESTPQPNQYKKEEEDIV